MPIYEYTCKICGASFEELILRSSDEAEVVCPTCGTPEVQRQMSCAAVQSSGGGGGGGGSVSSCSPGG